MCSRGGVPCRAIDQTAMRTPDFAIALEGVRVVCQVKQIDRNREDRDDVETPWLLEGSFRTVSGGS